MLSAFLTGMSPEDMPSALQGASAPCGLQSDFAVAGRAIVPFDIASVVKETADGALPEP